MDTAILALELQPGFRVF